jgi:hypothetical protein
MPTLTRWRPTRSCLWSTAAARRGAVFSLCYLPCFARKATRQLEGSWGGQHSDGCRNLQPAGNPAPSRTSSAQPTHRKKKRRQPAAPSLWVSRALAACCGHPPTHRAHLSRPPPAPPCARLPGAASRQTPALCRPRWQTGTRLQVEAGGRGRRQGAGRAGAWWSAGTSAAAVPWQRETSSSSSSSSSSYSATNRQSHPCTQLAGPGTG